MLGELKSLHASLCSVGDSKPRHSPLIPCSANSKLRSENYRDIYLLTVLVGLLGLVLLVRRPSVQQPPAGSGAARENSRPTVAAPVTPRRETEGAEASNSESTNNDSKSDKNVTSDPASRNATEEQRPP